MLHRHGAIEEEFDSAVHRAGRIELSRPLEQHGSGIGVWQRLREVSSPSFTTDASLGQTLSMRMQEGSLRILGNKEHRSPVAGVDSNAQQTDSGRLSARRPGA